MARVYDLQQRLLHYSANIIRLVESLPKTRTGNHVGGQLLRCGTSPLSNHGEAQAAESVDDFIHKISVCLKESRESLRWLLLVRLVPLVTPLTLTNDLITETDELIRIFIGAFRPPAVAGIARQKRQAPIRWLNVES